MTSLPVIPVKVKQLRRTGGSKRGSTSSRQISRLFAGVTQLIITPDSR